MVGSPSKGGIGDLVLVTLSGFTNRKKVKKRVIYLGLIISVQYWTFRPDGSFLKFFKNRILLFNRQYRFLGTRVYGPIGKEVKFKLKSEKEKSRFKKALSYTSLVL
jgi:large subunit ribosomal protein L14